MSLARRVLRSIGFVGVMMLGLAVPASAQDGATTTTVVATTEAPTTTTVAATSSSAAVILGVAPSTVSLPGEVAGTQEVAADDLAFTGSGSVALVVVGGVLLAVGLSVVSAGRHCAATTASSAGGARLSRSRSGLG